MSRPEEKRLDWSPLILGVLIVPLVIPFLLASPLILTWLGADEPPPRRP